MAVFFRGTGKARSRSSAQRWKARSFKTLVNFPSFPLLLFVFVGEGGDGRLPGRPFGYRSELLHLHSRPRTPMKYEFIKAYRDGIGIQTKQVHDSFIVPSAHNLLIETLKAMEGSVLFSSYLLVVSVNMHLMGYQALYFHIIYDGMCLRIFPSLLPLCRVFD